jgi:CelD/BcsL family acetyltransferase involved in cellulose biosynthesis
VSGLELHHDFAPLAGEWEALADRARSGPFSTPGWFEAWWQAFGRGQLELMALRRGGELAAVLPLQRRYGVRRALTNWHTPELRLPTADAAARAALLGHVLGGTRLPLLLGMVTAGTGEVADFKSAAAAAGMWTIVRRIERSPFVALESGWERYEADLPSQRRRELRRRRRRLEDRGELALEVADGSERLEPLLAEGFAVEGSGWKAEEGTAIESRPETRLFYARVARWAADRGSLRLAFLRLDGRAIAFHFTIEEGGSAYQLKGGYDPALRALAPGTLLIREMLAWAFERGLETYEFLGADEGFKLDWTSSTRERLSVQAFPRSAAGSLGWSAFAYGRPLAKRARDLMRR